VSIDGRIAISDLTIAGDPVNSTTVHDSDKLSSFSSCQWLTASRVASTSLEGALQIWDVRQLHQKPAIQTLVLPKRIAQCQPLTCLATHPGQPHIVISGDAGGRIVSWDLRSEWEPTCIAYAEANITGLHYSPMSSQLWMTTLTGTIGLVEETTIHTIFKEPVASIMDFCIPESGMLSDLYALNDQESLIFLANAA
jgi:WD40 repeat protein